MTLAIARLTGESRRDRATIRGALGAHMAEIDSRARRLQMINSQLRTCDVNEHEILEAFADVDRARFVAPSQRRVAYADGEVASAGQSGRKLLAPRTLALLLKCAAPQKGERALSVGGGAGYCAALLASMGLDVVDLETAAADPVAGVERIVGALDKPAGKGPFDVVVINGAFEVAPEALIDALKDGGRLVGVDARGGARHIVVYERSGEGVSERAAYDAWADVLPGFARPPAFVF